jgi:hypothetical protein
MATQSLPWSSYWVAVLMVASVEVCQSLMLLTLSMAWTRKS